MEACSFMFAKKRQPCYNILTKKGSLWVNGGNSMIAKRISIFTRQSNLDHWNKCS